VSVDNVSGSHSRLRLSLCANMMGIGEQAKSETRLHQTNHKQARVRKISSEVNPDV